MPSLVRGRKGSPGRPFPSTNARANGSRVRSWTEGSWGCHAGRIPTPGRARNRSASSASPSAPMAHSAGICSSHSGIPSRRTGTGPLSPAQGEGGGTLTAQGAGRGMHSGTRATRETPSQHRSQPPPCPGGYGHEAADPGVGPRLRLLAPPLAAVIPGVPALLARRISKLAVHVLGSTVSPARQRSRSETNQARESPDGQDQGGEEENSLPPRHLDHLDPSGC